jgi:hypothetical protein
MIRRATIVRFDREVTAGRNRPFLAGLETHDGEEVDAFVKITHRCRELREEALANETISALLAGDLALPVNEPFLVDITPEFIISIEQDLPQLANDLRNSNPVTFASRAAGTQWVGWSQADTIAQQNRQVALEIFAFDAFVENSDRRLDNPNLLKRGDELRIIDHELAFCIAMQLFPPATPWINGNLNRLIQPGGHLFARFLAGKNGLDIQAVHQKWSDLSDVRIDEYTSALPAEWNCVGDKIASALSHIRDVRDRIDDCIVELERVLI